MPDRSRRARLRESTSQAHVSLDRMVGAFDTQKSYRDYLRGIAAFREAVEQSLSSAAWPQALCDLRDEPLSALIAQDLRDLNVEPQPRIKAPHLTSGVEELFGMLYVIEGSALGARVLYKRAQALGLSADFGARHLAEQSRRSDRWSRFLALLESVDAIDMERVAIASQATFQTAETAFRQGLHE